MAHLLFPVGLHAIPTRGWYSCESALNNVLPPATQSPGGHPARFEPAWTIRPVAGLKLENRFCSSVAGNIYSYRNPTVTVSRGAICQASCIKPDTSLKVKAYSESRFRKSTIVA